MLEQLFNKSINEIDYSDVVEFCKQGSEEGLFLEYKEKFVKDLQKRIASFANTNGGLIILGVKENKRSGSNAGKPIKWEGIDNENDLSERVNTVIANVTPYPTVYFKIVPFPNNDQKCFVIVEVTEGYDTPYIPINKPTVYVRNGDVTTLFDQARRDDLIRLLRKKEVAKENRQYSIDLANSLHQGTKTLNNTIPVHRVALRPILKIDIMPYNPSQSLMNAEEMLANYHDWFYFSMKAMNLGIKTTVGGIITDSNVDTSNGDLNQMYIGELGHIAFRKQDVWVEGLPNYDKPHIYLFYCALQLLQAIRLASIFYKATGYNGSIVMNLVLDNMHNKNVLGTTDLLAYDRSSVGVLNLYNNYTELTTKDINNLDKQIKLVLSFMNKFYSYFGLSDPSLEKKLSDYSKNHQFS